MGFHGLVPYDSHLKTTTYIVTLEFDEDPGDSLIFEKLSQALGSMISRIRIARKEEKNV